MNRIITLAALLVFFSPAASAWALFFEDFENGFAPADLNSAPWSIEESSPSHNPDIRGGPPTNITNVLEIEGSGSTDDHVLLTLPAADQIPVGFLEFDAYIPTDTAPPYGGFRLRVRDTGGWRTAEFYVSYGWGTRPDTSTNLASGGDIANSVMSVGTWTHWTLGWDIPNETITLNVGGNDVYPGGLSLSEAGHPTTTSVGDVGFWAYNNRDAMIDNVRVDVTPTPEPASAILIAIGGLAVLFRRRGC